MKRTFFLFVMSVFFLATLAFAEVTTERPECVSYAPGKIVVKGTVFTELHLQAEPHIEIASVDKKGTAVGGNTKFAFTPTKELNCFTFKSGAKWALIDMTVVKQWSKASGGKIGGAKVFKDDKPQGYCLRVKNEGDAEVVRLDEFTD